MAIAEDGRLMAICIAMLSNHLAEELIDGLWTPAQLATALAAVSASLVKGYGVSSAEIVDLLRAYRDYVDSSDERVGD